MIKIMCVISHSRVVTHFVRLFPIYCNNESNTASISFKCWIVESLLRRKRPGFGPVHGFYLKVSTDFKVNLKNFTPNEEHQVEESVIVLCLEKLKEKIKTNYIPEEETNREKKMIVNC